MTHNSQEKEIVLLLQLFAEWIHRLWFLLHFLQTRAFFLEECLITNFVLSVVEKLLLSPIPTKRISQSLASWKTAPSIRCLYRHCLQQRIVVVGGGQDQSTLPKPFISNLAHNISNCEEDKKFKIQELWEKRDFTGEILSTRGFNWVILIWVRSAKSPPVCMKRTLWPENNIFASNNIPRTALKV
jgi:hypothetical protein